MNTKLLRKARDEQEKKEIEELFNSSSEFRSILTEILQGEMEELETQALNLKPSLMLNKRYFKLIAEIKARKSIINLLK